MRRKKTKEEFISDFRSVHGDKYDYSLVIYVNNKTKVKIICKEHGVFEQNPNNHVNGQNCKYCTNNNIRYSTNIFIENSLKKFGNVLDYSLVKYVNNKTNVKLICKKHGIFEQRPDNHFNHKIPCKKCDSENRLLEKNNLINLLNEVHNKFYDYSKLVYNGRNRKSKIVCPKHGEFEQIINAHIYGSGCSECSQSKGERLIYNILKENNIKFKTEHKFDDCLYKSKLKFDFYIPSMNVCIEFNGLQHYKPIDFFGGNLYFEEIKKRDLIKEEYCKMKDIKLVKIKYTLCVDEIKKIIFSLI